MWTWCIVNDKFDKSEKLAALGGHALENIVDQHSHELLCLMMRGFYQTLFARTPWRTEASANSYEGTKFLHKCIFKFSATIGTNQ